MSGGEPKAIDSTLSVMVGGDKAIFDKYYDLMKRMAGSVVCIPGKSVQVTSQTGKSGHCGAEYCRDVRSANAGNQSGR